MRQMVGQIIKMRGALWVNAFLYYFSRLWMVGRLVPPTAYAGYRAKKALSAAAVAVRQIIDLCGKPLYLLTFLLLPVILLAGSRPQFAGQEFSLFLSMLFFLSCILGAFGDSHIFNVTREKVAFLKYLHADARSYIQASLALRYVPFFLLLSSLPSAGCMAFRRAAVAGRGRLGSAGGFPHDERSLPSVCVRPHGACACPQHRVRLARHRRGAGGGIRAAAAGP